MPMFDSTPIANPAAKPAFYLELDQQLASLIEGEPDAIANAANMSALLYHAMPELNWAGFYFLPEGTDVLVVGPFQGKPACVRIPIGKGVCGTAVAKRETILVPDVHAFPGHIACDAASQSAGETARESESVSLDATVFPLSPIRVSGKARQCS